MMLGLGWKKISYILTMELVHRFLQGASISLIMYGSFLSPYIIKAFYIKTENWKGLWALSINWPLAIPFFMVGVGTVFMFSKWIAPFCGALKTKVLAVLALSSVVVPLHVVYYQCLANELDMQDCLFSLDLFGHNIFSIVREWSKMEKVDELHRLLSKSLVETSVSTLFECAEKNATMDGIREAAKELMKSYYERFDPYTTTLLDTSGTSVKQVIGKDYPDKSYILGSIIYWGVYAALGVSFLSKTELLKSFSEIDPGFGTLLVGSQLFMIVWKKWKEKKEKEEKDEENGKEKTSEEQVEEIEIEETESDCFKKFEEEDIKELAEEFDEFLDRFL